MDVDLPAGRPGFRPAHPGRIIKRSVEALGMTIEAFADHIGKSRQTVHAIISGRSGVTADVAARLARAFGTSVQFWLNLQVNHDAWEAERAPGVLRVGRLKAVGGKSVTKRSSTKKVDRRQAAVRARAGGR